MITWYSDEKKKTLALIRNSPLLNAAKESYLCVTRDFLRNAFPPHHLKLSSSELHRGGPYLYCHLAVVGDWKLRVASEVANGSKRENFIVALVPTTANVSIVLFQTLCLAREKNHLFANDGNRIGSVPYIY
jgi:hypothetical protein